MVIASPAHLHRRRLELLPHLLIYASRLPYDTPLRNHVRSVATSLDATQLMRIQNTRIVNPVLPSRTRPRTMFDIEDPRGIIVDLLATVEDLVPYLGHTIRLDHIHEATILREDAGITTKRHLLRPLGMDWGGLTMGVEM